MKLHSLNGCSCIDENVVYEEVPEPHIIETGDSVKVKQVLDEATVAALQDLAYEADWSWDNFKLLLMFVACVFALVAQFAPIPFPKSRPIVAVCCGFYFVISSVLQYFISYVDKETIMFLKAKSVSAK